jgi:diphosphomevalonate decarboxylase
MQIDVRIYNIVMWELQAILSKDFETFAEITMKDSNQMHAICLDTFPTCVYMSDVSHGISHLIHRLNALAGKPIVIITNKCNTFLEIDKPLFLM